MIFFEVQILIYMKNIFYSIVCFLITSSFSWGETPTDFIKRWASDFNKDDPKVISSYYENTKDLEMLVSIGMWHHGFDEMLKAYTRDSKHLDYYDSKIQDLRARTFGKTAIVSFVHRFKFRVLKTGERVQVHIRTTSTLRKVDGKWFIVLEHSSAIKGQPRDVLIKGDLE